MSDQVPGTTPGPSGSQLDALQAKAAILRQTIDKSSAVASNAPSSWWNTHDAMTMSAAVLVFGAAIVAVAAYLIRGEKDGQLVLRVLATVSILTFAVFLIVAGYSDQQIAPAFGLLGTIAGYLLGKDSKPTPPPP